MAQISLDKDAVMDSVIRLERLTEEARSTVEKFAEFVSEAHSASSLTWIKYISDFAERQKISSKKVTDVVQSAKTALIRHFNEFDEFDTETIPGLR